MECQEAETKQSRTHLQPKPHLTSPPNFPFQAKLNYANLTTQKYPLYDTLTPIIRFNKFLVKFATLCMSVNRASECRGVERDHQEVEKAGNFEEPPRGN